MAAMMGAVILILVAGTTWMTCGFQGCPDPDQLGGYQAGAGPLLLDQHGQEIGRLHPLERDAVPLDALPEHVPAAFLAVEDRRFHQHRGVDWIRVAGAAVRNVRQGRLAEGASTLTMQLARTGFPERIPGTERTLRRKLMEVRAARDIEGRFSKDEILELYLNHLYLGGGAYGVEAAARYHFDRPASELEPAQAALLAALARSPGFYDPRRHPDRATARRDLVLSLMEEEGHLTSEARDLALAEPLGVVPDPPAAQPPLQAPYFAEAVRGFLQERFGDELYQSGFVVQTTLDLQVQDAAEQALEEGLEEWERTVGPSAEGLQGAVVALDSEGGGVRGLVGGRDFTRSRFDRATGARRQLGSSFKPFVVAAALERGIPTSQMLADEPLRVDRAGSEPWTPRNYDGEYRGPVSVRQTLVESLNVPTARLALATGRGRVGRTASAVGVGDGDEENPAAALGTVALAPLQVAVGYAALAAGGQRPEPHKVERVEWEDGTVLYQHEPAWEEVLDPAVAHVVTSMLVDAVNEGTGRPVRAVGYQGPAAGKTGTTQDARDAWFSGFTEELTAAVWVGHDEPRALGPGATGGSLAAPIWGRFAAEAVPAGVPRDRLPGEPPSGVVSREVERDSGRVVEDGCPSPEGGTRSEVFLVQAVPEAICPESRNVVRRLADRLRGRGGSEDEAASEGPGAPGSVEAAGPVSPAAEVQRLLGVAPLSTRSLAPSAGGGGDGSTPDQDLNR